MLLRVDWPGGGGTRAFCIKASREGTQVHGDGDGARDSRCEQIENRLAF